MLRNSEERVAAFIGLWLYAFQSVLVRWHIGLLLLHRNIWNSDLTDGEHWEVKMPFLLLDFRRPTNTVCHLGKWILAILRRDFNGRPILIPSLWKLIGQLQSTQAMSTTSSIRIADEVFQEGWCCRHCPSQSHRDPSVQGVIKGW